VLKFRSRLLTGGTTTLDPERMRMIAAVVAEAPDVDVVIASSGAIAAGFRALGHTSPPTRIRERQAAAVGQTRLMALWSQAFHEVGREVAQILLTNDGLTDRRRYVAARRALATLLEAGVVPIVNENDTVSVEEIVVGDNDNLAASTAVLVDANILALLTDVPGVYDGDPDGHAPVTLIREAASAEELRRFCYAKKARESTGGMHTKLEAAEPAGGCGIPTVIASGTDVEGGRSRFTRRTFNSARVRSPESRAEPAASRLRRTAPSPRAEG